jgi:hypothetical protein
MKTKLSRRSVLKALGLFASLPVGRLVYDSIAQAQGVTPTLRFIGAYHPHGICHELWARRPGETETQFQLDFAESVLTPFDSPQLYGRSFKDKLITLEGVDLAAAELSRTSGHGAAVTLFTGSTTTSTERDARGPSLDQHLARTLGLGQGTRFPTLNLGVGSSGSRNEDAIAHGPGGSVIRNELDPLAVFDRVFGTMGGVVDQAQVTAARLRGQSVIDFVRGDLNSLSGRLAPQERVKLEQHLDSLRDIETRLHAAQPTCVAPARPRRSGNTDPADDFARLEEFRGGEPYFERIGDLMIDLLALAMACDATRFATLFLEGPGRPRTVDGVQLPLDVHNEVAHRYARGTSPAAVATQLKLGRLNRYYYGKLARLLQRLDEAQLLDSTLVLAGSDMGNPAAHSTRNIPLLLAGGANGRLVMGRRLRAGPDCPTGGQFCEGADLALTPHNRVLVSVARLFGDTSDSFGVGDPSLVRGTFPGL